MEKFINLVIYANPQTRANTNYTTPSFYLPWTCIPQRYDGNIEAYFESVFSITPGFSGTIQLFDGTNEITAISTESSTPTLVRSPNIWSSLVSGTNYYPRFRSSNNAGTTTLYSSRIVIYQSGTITKTETTYDFGENFNSNTGTAFVLDTNKGFWLYEPSNWNGLTGIYYEAMIGHAVTTGTTFAAIYNTNTNSIISDSEVSGSGVIDLYKRSNNFIFNLETGTLYGVGIKNLFQSTANARTRNGRLVLVQSNFTNSITYYTQPRQVYNTVTNSTGITVPTQIQWLSTRWEGTTGSLFLESTASVNAAVLGNFNLVDNSANIISTLKFTGTARILRTGPIIPSLVNETLYNFNTQSSGTLSFYQGGLAYAYSFVQANPPIDISLNTLRITGSAISFTVIPGSISTTISTLGLTGSAIPLSIIPGNVSVSISTLGLTGSAIFLTPIGGSISIGLNSLGITGSAIGISIVPGTVSIPLSTLGLSGSSINLSVIPSAVSVLLSSLGLTGTVVPISVTSFSSSTVLLTTLNLTGSIHNLTVIPGTVTLSLSSLGLTGSAVSLSILPDAISLLLNTLGLSSTVTDLSIFIPSSILSNKRIYHVGNENRILLVSREDRIMRIDESE